MTDHILTAVAWPYANGPRHIGHVAGFGVPSDVFSRYQRMIGNKVLMVSGTDEHGTPIQVQADNEGLTPRELADRNALVIAKDLQKLGLSYDLFTRTTTKNHYAVTQQIFLGLLANGYVFPQTQLGAISPSTGRTLPDRYIEGTCPICGYPSARGDQCDNCGNQLDPIDLINPVSKINGETPTFVETEHYFLDLGSFAEVLAQWLRKQTHWRSNVQKFSLNLLDDLKPRAITRDLEWGIPVPLDGWRDRTDKKIYVWFDAVIGYLSASIEWAQRSGDPEAWRAWWQADPTTGQAPRSYYFMGKDNIVFHSEIWPAMLMGYSGIGAKGGTPGPLGALDRPYEVVSSEFLTMEGKKFSSSRGVVIYVGDMLSRYDPDALRYYLATAGPENQDTDFTWAEFVRRNNDELVAGWGNLVNRTISMTAKNLGAIPAPGALTDADHALLASSRAAFASVGDLLARSRQKAAIGEAMAVVSTANKYLSDHEPWKLKNTDPERMASVLHVALQVVDDAKTLLTPFLPTSSTRVHQALHGDERWAGMPELVEVDEETAVGSPSYSVLTGDYDTGATWESTPIDVGRPLAAPTPVFTKLDPKLVDEELARLAPVSDEIDVEPLAVPVFDAHTHLDAMASRAGVSADAAFVAAAMAQARAVGVVAAVTVGDTVASSQWCVGAAQDHPDVWAAVAVHPTEIGGLDDAGYAELERLAADPRVVAVGETGLDYHWDRTGPREQQEHFRRHIALAKQVGKPLMIHDRDAHADVLRILREEGAPDQVVFHAFSGDVEMALECVRAGYLLSFPGVVTFTNAPSLRAAAAVTPAEHLLVETDAPFLTPHPLRGRPNAPRLLPITVRGLAAAAGLPVDRLARSIQENGRRVFGITIG